MSDIAVNCENWRDEVIVNQVETLATLTNLIKTSRDSNSIQPIQLCKATVPLLLGLSRSMGRYTSISPPLLCRLFPRVDMPSIKPVDVKPIQHENRQSHFNHFRSIIPRSMSGSFLIEIPDKTSYVRNKSIPPYDTTTYFFSKFGSSFNQFPNMRFNESMDNLPRIQFPISHLQTIFALAKKLLTKETLEHLDEQAADIFALRQIKPYGYKSFSETINLVMVTLLRELLQNQSGNFQNLYFFIHQCK